MQEQNRRQVQQATPRSKGKLLSVSLFILGIVCTLLVSRFVVPLFSAQEEVEADVKFDVAQIHNLATLATAEASFQVMLNIEDNKLFGKELPFNWKLPGTKRHVIVIVPASISAGVDLAQVKEQDVVINEERTEIRLTLPRAQFLQDATLHMEQIETYSDEGLFRSEMDWEEGYDVMAEAQRKALEKAESLELLQKAEQNAERVLQSLFAQLQYETVSVEFR